MKFVGLIYWRKEGIYNYDIYLRKIKDGQKGINPFLEIFAFPHRSPNGQKPVRGDISQDRSDYAKMLYPFL